MFKYEIDQTVWYLKNNKVHSAPVLSRKYVDNLFDKSMRCTEQQEEAFGRFGNEGVIYATIHGEYSEIELFHSREALARSILIEPKEYENRDRSLFKFDRDQEVWYMIDNEVHSAPILSRKYVDNLFDKSMRCTEQQEEAFGRFGNEGIYYATIDGIFSENKLYESAKKLSEAILNEK